MTPLDTLLQRVGLSVPDLAGTAAGGEVPLTEPVVNRVIAAQLAARQLPVTGVELEAHEGDAFTAHVALRNKLLRSLRVHVRIERQARLPEDPVVWLRWSIPGAGPLALFAAPALSLFKALPPGVTADSDRIAIDVRQVLAARGLGEMSGYLKNLEIHTRPGGFVVRADVKL